MLTNDQQTLAVLFVGETTDPAGLLADNVTALAAKYDGLDAALPENMVGVSLEDLYVQRDLCKIALGACRARVHTLTPDMTRDAQQESARLAAMLAALMAEIAEVTATARSFGGVAVGLLTTVEPISPPSPNSFNANDRSLHGDAYLPLRRRSPF